MDIDKVNYFFTAAELCNFTKAAQKCQITQAAMSKYINSLETELECKLFYRNNKGCTLTEKGKAFYDKMQTLSAMYEDVKSDLRVTSGPRIRTGIEGEHHSIPEFQLFQANNPEIVFDISFGERDALVEDLGDGKLDVLLLLNIRPEGDDAQMKPFRTIDLPGEKECLICSETAMMRFGSVEGVIKSLPMITKTDDPAYHRYAKAGLKSRFGVDIGDIRVIDSIANQQLVVSLSKGFAIVPRFEIPEGSAFHVVPMDEVFMTALKLVYDPHHLSKEAKKLTSFIRKIFSAK